MRQLILKISMTLDGFVGGPSGEIDWLFRSMDDEGARWIVDTLWQAGAHLMGSRTFRDMAAYWPTSTEPFAAPMNEIPKVYFTRGSSGTTTTQALADAQARDAGARHDSPSASGTWSTARAVRGDLADEVARLKREPGKDLLAHGGATFAQSLVRLGLVDEYRLLIHPVAIGRGLPLFAARPAPLDLALVDTRRFASGTVAHVYRPKG